MLFDVKIDVNNVKKSRKTTNQKVKTLRKTNKAE